MKSTAKSVTITGIVVVAGFAFALYLALTASTGLPGQSFRTVSASFEEIGGLRTGDDVRMGSVRVGQVRSIEYEDGRALVTMQMDPDETVNQDASAQIVARSALGQNFVEVTPGTPDAGEMPQGGAIPAERSVSQVTLDQVLTTLDEPTRDGLTSTLREVGGGAMGQGPNLAGFLDSAPALLGDLSGVTTALAAPEANLEGLLVEADQLAGRFDGRADQIASMVTDLSATLEAVAVDDAQPLSETLQAAPATLAQARTALASADQPLDEVTTTLTTLRPGIGALAESTPDLRTVLTEGQTPVGRVPGVSELAIPAVDQLNGLLVDARPLSERLEVTTANAQEPLGVLEPYAPEASSFFTRWASANQYGDASGNYLRISLVIRPETLTGSLPIADPFVHRNPYPAPGEADHDQSSALLGSR